MSEEEELLIWHMYAIMAAIHNRRAELQKMDKIIVGVLAHQHTRMFDQKTLDENRWWPYLYFDNSSD